MIHNIFDHLDILFPAFTGMIGVIIPAYLLHIREIKKLKNEISQHTMRGNVLDKILDLALLNDLKASTERIFKETKADRFLILIAINGKVDFNTVSVIFERHKNFTTSAIARYRNLSIDTQYRKMLKIAEQQRSIIVETSNMEESLLKNIYELEGVTHSEIRHLKRQKLDNNNDCLIYSSIATHSKLKFTNKELASIQINIDNSIKPTIDKMLD